MMRDIAAILAFIKRTYPVPDVNPAWVQECVEALEAAGQPTTVDELHAQYLHADLAYSTLESRPPVFPATQGELLDIVLCARPTLFQIVAISEVGNSAFQLQTIMEQRSEVLSGQSRIRRMDDEDEDEDMGKVPPYPRSMLRLEISDGRRVVKAMEYRKIAELVLGQTSLGCKLLVQNVRSLRDVLLLSPDNCQVLESSVEHIEALQRAQFVGDLNRRMGKGDVATVDVGEIQPARALPPPVRNAERPQVRRARPPPASPPAARAHPIVRPQPERHPAVQSAAKRKAKSHNPSEFEVEEDEAPIPKRRTSRAAAQKATARLDKLYDTNPPLDMDTRTKDEIGGEDEEDEFDYVVDESFLRHVEEAEARASTSNPTYRKQGRGDYDDEYEGEADESVVLLASDGRHKPKTSPYFQSSSRQNGTKATPTPRQKSGRTAENYVEAEDDDEYDFVDESFIRQIDEVEARASNKRVNSSGQSSTLAGSSGGAIRRKGRERVPLEVIEISD